MISWQKWTETRKSDKNDNTTKADTKGQNKNGQCRAERTKQIRTKQTQTDKAENKGQNNEKTRLKRNGTNEWR